MRFLPEDSTPLSAARGVMKKNPAPRSAFILFAIRRANGIPKTSARSFGIFSTRASKDRKAFAFFRCPTGRNSTFGVWLYIHAEKIPIVPLYYARERQAVVRNGAIVLIYSPDELLPGEKLQSIKCRMRSLGCIPCTGAIRSEADTVPKIIEEMISFRRSERENRAIDHDEEGSMELKKREGYF